MKVNPLLVKSSLLFAMSNETVPLSAAAGERHCRVVADSHVAGDRNVPNRHPMKRVFTKFVPTAVTNVRPLTGPVDGSRDTKVGAATSATSTQIHHTHGTNEKQKYTEALHNSYRGR